MSRAAALALLIIAFPLGAAPVPKELKNAGTTVGTWRLESLVIYGEPCNPQNEHWTLARDGNVHMHTGPVQRPANYRGYFELVFEPRTKAVDYHYTNGGNLNYPGLYELKGDTLRICCNMREHKGVRPTALAAGPDVYLWTFERVSEAKK